MAAMNKFNETVAYLKTHGITEPEVGIVLGTGLGRLAEDIDPIAVLNYEDIPHFPLSTVESHKGKLIYGELSGKKVVAMQGRFHYYEGYDFKEITYPIRVMKLLGIGCLLLSNACGGINTNFKKGDLMLLDDHIDLLPDNPLRGKNLEEFGPRFPDMSQPYHPALNAQLEQVAQEEGHGLHKGVYAAVSGPNLETRAEYRYLGRIGADVVGMSTVPEVIVCNHMSLPCAAISVITDECDPDNLQPVNIDEIIEVAGRAELKLVSIFKAFLSQYNGV